MQNTELTKSTDIAASAYPLASLLLDITSAYDTQTSVASHRVAIALGSNLGDRFANIELALRLLENPRALVDAAVLGEDAEICIVDTSFLYETVPMYVTDQPYFINCACLVRFSPPFI
jgi:dihydroneopterin aldolase/2-amino-4-hydroxy-6-hydroxymethyldihydropteridine diphosphokinase/dihydropteroate synthase